MIVETDHPYANGLDTLHTITIPDAVFLSLVFDERCSTEEDADFLQLYQDPQKQTPIGEKLSGNRSK